MKIWERRLMKDFQVAPVEINENESEQPVEENPLDRFRRIGKQVAAQSTSAKWTEVIRGAHEANSQIGRCRNRESFRNQQNLLKAMEQAKKLIDRSPLPQSPAHSDTYSVVNQTNETLLQLLKNISEEINEISPNQTLKVTTPHNRSVTPLHSLNAQLQSLISSKNPSPYQTKEKPKTRSSSPRPPVLNLRKPTPSTDGIMSPPPKPLPESPKTPISPKSYPETPKSPKSPKSPSKFELTKSPLSKPPTSILKNRSPTPDSCKSLDDGRIVDNVKVKDESVQKQSKQPPMMSTPSIEISCENDTPSPSSIETKPQSPTLIDLRDQDKSEIVPLAQVPASPVKVIKRKAPVPTPDVAQQDISISRPVSAKVASNQGMLPPPPSKADEIKQPLQIPILSTTPATPLPVQKQLASTLSETPLPPAVEKSEASEIPTPSVITSDFTQSFSSTEALVSSKDPSLDANMAASSPPSCLRPVRKIEDVKTIKRQMKTGWL